MNRRSVLIAIGMLALVGLLSFSLGTSVAQINQSPPDGGSSIPSELEVEGLPVDAPEPAVYEVENPEALVPDTFTYQGQLKKNGAPVSGSCDFIWDIFDVVSGGASLATDSDAAVAVSNGLFTVQIDVPSSVFDGRRLFLEIQVRCPSSPGIYTTLTPREALHAAPYALGLRLPFAHTIANASAPIFSVTNSSTSTHSPSFLGSSAGGDGVRGLSTGESMADNGVYGETNSPSGTDAGVRGASTSTSSGGYFSSTSGNGVYGHTNSATYYGGNFHNFAGGAALYAGGDVKQSLDSDGFVKAGVFAWCGNFGGNIFRSFNLVSATPITIINGSSPGKCTIDFGFDVRDNRFFSALANSPNSLTVTFVPGSTTTSLDFFRSDQAGDGSTGPIMVLIY
jgi:hypothetical protein